MNPWCKAPGCSGCGTPVVGLSGSLSGTPHLGVTIRWHVPIDQVQHVLHTVMCDTRRPAENDDRYAPFPHA